MEPRSGRLCGKMPGMRRGAKVAFVGVLVPGCVIPPIPEPVSCEEDSDCEQPEDNRYRAVCAANDEGEMVCTAGFSVIGCGPEAYVDAPWAGLMDPERYEGNCEASPGTRSCAPPCVAGLEENEHGVCDDDDPSTPIAGPVVPGQDVLDQICRSFFCDEAFVCESDRSVCEPCDATKPFGRGGCGAIYLGDQLSCAYQSPPELERDCHAPHSAIVLVELGPCE